MLHYAEFYNIFRFKILELLVHMSICFAKWYRLLQFYYLFNTRWNVYMKVYVCILQESIVDRYFTGAVSCEMMVCINNESKMCIKFTTFFYLGFFTFFNFKTIRNQTCEDKEIL